MKKFLKYLFLIIILLFSLNGCIFKKKKHHKNSTNTSHSQNISQSENSSQSKENSSQLKDTKIIKGVAYDGPIYNGKVQILDQSGNIIGEGKTSDDSTKLGEFTISIKKELPKIYFIKLVNGKDSSFDNIINKNDFNISIPLFSVGEENSTFISITPISDIWYQIMVNYNYSFEDTKNILNNAFHIDNNLTLLYLNPKKNLLLKKLILFMNAIYNAMPYDNNDCENEFVKYIITNQNLINVNKLDYPNINMNALFGENYYTEDENDFINNNIFDILNATNENNISLIISSLKSINLINLKNNETNNIFYSNAISSLLLNDINLNFFDLNDINLFKRKSTKVISNIDLDFLTDNFNIVDYVILNNLYKSNNILSDIINNSKQVIENNISSDENNINSLQDIKTNKKLLYLFLISNNDANISYAVKIAKNFDVSQLSRFINETYPSYMMNMKIGQYIDLLFNMYAVYIIKKKKIQGIYDSTITRNFMSVVKSFVFYGDLFNYLFNSIEKNKYSYLVLKTIMLNYVNSNIVDNYPIGQNLVKLLSKNINQIIDKIKSFGENDKKIITLVSLCKYIDLYNFDNDFNSRIIPLTNKIYNSFNQRNVSYMASLENFESKFKDKLINKEQINDSDINSSIIYPDKKNIVIPMIPKIIDLNFEK